MRSMELALWILGGVIAWTLPAVLLARREAPRDYREKYAVSEGSEEERRAIALAWVRKGFWTAVVAGPVAVVAILWGRAINRENPVERWAVNSVPEHREYLNQKRVEALEEELRVVLGELTHGERKDLDRR